MNVVDRIMHMLQTQGEDLYGGEAVTQKQHALQAATLAEQENAGDALIAAALVHDIGHFMEGRDEATFVATAEVDYDHEHLAQRFLEPHFGPEVIEPVRLHVAAKRYLCATDPAYRTKLSPASEASLRGQGGPMSPDEVAEFENHPHYQAAVQLRHWDDKAKDVTMQTPDVTHFRGYLEAVIKSN